MFYIPFFWIWTLTEMKSSTVNAHIFVWMDNDRQNCNRYGDAIKLSNTIQSCVSVSMVVYAAVVYYFKFLLLFKIIWTIWKNAG